MKDKFEKTIVPGNFIVYGVARNSSGDLKVGIALKNNQDETLTVMSLGRVANTLSFRTSILNFGYKIMVIGPGQLSSELEDLLTSYYKEYIK